MLMLILQVCCHILAIHLQIPLYICLYSYHYFPLAPVDEFVTSQSHRSDEMMDFHIHWDLCEKFLLTD